MFNKLAIYMFNKFLSHPVQHQKPLIFNRLMIKIMSCNELKLAFEKAEVINEAHINKGLTNENILTGLFFFPAYFVTYGTSIHAEYNASERKGISKSIITKKCAKPKSVEYQKTVSNALVQLENLKKQYIKGAIEKRKLY